MKNKESNIGRITKVDFLKANKIADRSLELENSNGWVCRHKAHKSIKDYKRNPKHKVNIF